MHPPIGVLRESLCPMSANSIPQAALDVIYLSTCAINQTSPDRDRVMSMDIGAAYNMARRHMMVSACATALESAGFIDQRFNNAKFKAIRKMTLMDAERVRLFRSLDDFGIWYLPLKGCVLKDYYPAYGMREMSDNDILFDESRSADVKTILEAQGFETIKYNVSNHDIYHKPPVCNFEMHRELMDSLVFPSGQDYYDDVNRLLVPDGSNTSGCHMRDEDFYIYMIAHEYKHFIYAGTGFRPLLDIYVFLKAKGEHLDWSYIDHELKLLGINEFEARNRQLAVSLFSSQELAPDDADLLSTMVDSGLYGSLANKVSNRLKHEGRARYLLHSIFKPYGNMARYYPILKRAPILLPFFWVHRIAAAAVTQPKRSLYIFAGAFRKAKNKDAS